MSGDPVEFGKVTMVTPSTTLRVTTLQVRGVGPEGSDDESEPLDGVEFAQPLGLASNPTLSEHTEAGFVRHGDEVVCLVIVDKSRAAQTVEAGETRLYGCGSGNAAAVIRIRASGAIDITSKAATDITLNGGSLKVARVTDPITVNLTALQIGTIIAPAGGGPCTGGPIAITGTIDSGGGATRVKA